MPFGKIIECVPNFSEGRDRSVIDAIARSIGAVPGAFLIGVDPQADANRTVYTFAGEPEAVLAAALAAARAAALLIDMSRQSGAHPRMGALDVCPFVPVSGATMEDCVELSRRFGEALALELGVPVYLYERSAARAGRRSLAAVRSGEYEGLRERLARDEWRPDYGPASFVPRWGATAVGARGLLVAYNVNIDARDAAAAGEIAAALRESGRLARDAAGGIIRDAGGRAVRVPGLLKSVRAIGWYMESYGCAQVSTNVLDYRETPLHRVYEAVRAEAARLGLEARGSEIVGLAPLEAILEAGRHCLPAAGDAGEGALVGAAIRFLGLDSVSPFDPGRKILEYAIERASAGNG